jgi:hypothetical protein
MTRACGSDAYAQYNSARDCLNTVGKGHAAGVGSRGGPPGTPRCGRRGADIFTRRTCSSAECLSVQPSVRLAVGQWTCEKLRIDPCVHVHDKITGMHGL